MKLELACQEFLKEIEVWKYTPRTIRSYRNSLNLFLHFCADNGVNDTEYLLLSTVKAFTLFMSERGRKGTYINSLLKSIKSFIQYCYNEEYGGFNTKGKFTWCKEEKPIIRAFQAKDVKKMLADCGGRDFLSIRDKAILTTLFETGIRCYELCCIKPEDIHDDFIIINGKNHKQRVVPVTPILRKALIKYEVARSNQFPYSEKEFYFVSFRDRQLTNSAVEHIIKHHGEGIEDIRVSPHTCRHFYAQQQVKLGTDLYTISRLLGHENIGITQTYLNSLRDEDVIQTAKQRSVLLSL